MKTLLLALALTATALPSIAGEHYTLISENQQNQIGESESITLNQGDTAELQFAHYTNGTPEPNFFRVAIAAAGKSFEVTAIRERAKEAFGTTYETNPVKVAGPAVIKMKIGYDANAAPSKGIATIEVNRAGTAGTPTGIPLEAGTTWQVILEASTDLVNWTAVAPGDYPSATPQRFFRTRLVKRP